MASRPCVGVVIFCAGARVGNRLDVTRTDALVSQSETGKINCVHPIAAGCHPARALNKLRLPQKGFKLG